MRNAKCDFEKTSSKLDHQKQTFLARVFLNEYMLAYNVWFL